MPSTGPVQTENIAVLLGAIATGVALVSRWIRVPYTVALVIAGLVLGALHVVTPPHLTRELLFALFLPGLVFEAAYHLRYGEVKRNGMAVVALAVPGVVVALLVTAALLVASSRMFSIGGGIGWPQALVFGALIAGTDPIAVVALFRSLGAPARLSMLLEAESLLNDGTAIVVFGLILTATAGAGVSFSALVIDFASVVGIGLAVGAGLGYLLCQVTRRINDPMVEITLTAIAAYGSFALAEQLGGSGVIATVIAGLVCGNYGAEVGMSEPTRRAVESFWEYIAFLLNSIVFLLVGFEVQVAALVASLPLILVAFLAVLLARGVVVGGVTAGISRTAYRVPASWVLPLTWGGLRGALAMVLALSLPDEFRQREMIVTTTFGVVILSIVLQGVTMSALLRRTGLVRGRRIGTTG
jgi:CPA1 family monovalent cation:H+ antiporter